jgi:hypothetical protein
MRAARVLIVVFSMLLECRCATTTAHSNNGADKVVDELASVIAQLRGNGASVKRATRAIYVAFLPFESNKNGIADLDGIQSGFWSPTSGLAETEYIIYFSTGAKAAPTVAVIEEVLSTVPDAKLQERTYFFSYQNCHWINSEELLSPAEKKELDNLRSSAD